MPRPALTPAAARKTADGHVAASRAALVTLSRPLSASDVCDCAPGNAAGITEAECGCLYLEAAKVLEAAGCYIRRQTAKGLLS